MFPLILPLLGLVMKVAPSLITALAGPKAGEVATKVATVAQVVTGTTNQQDAAAALEANPNQVSALQAQLAQIALETAQAEAADMANARGREIATHDSTPKVLAYGVTAGFFALLGFMAVHGVPPDSATKDVLNIMLGGLSTGWAAILSYYYGASAIQAIGALRGPRQ